MLSSPPKLYRRSLGNFLDTISIVKRRFAVRAARYPEIPWLVWLFAWLLLAMVVFLSLDSAAGRMRGMWTPGFVHFTDFFTDFGLGGWYLIPAALCLVAANLTDWRSLSRRTRLFVYNWTCFAFLVLCAVGLSGLAVNLLKYGIGRARPLYFTDFGVLSLHPFAMDARFAGFPSGHATTMGAVFGVLLLLFPRRWYLALAVTASIASTRVFVGAHYPSDTVAGFGLGLAFAIATGLVFARLGFIFRRPSSQRPERKRTFRLGWPNAARRRELIAKQSGRLSADHP
ncbi:phosphatase PAP2 family protein [Mesorhizobium sp. M4B.F.Ca.ET.215.01.1.1]|uniref:phosphatase PAP2 family protein n=2 Tax=Mesorhizobium TaxID=68287 RepID=UPI000FD30C37|nr:MULTISPECIES: phosphatase PAP2 family protein [unclassified Mesorhizobium]RUW19663.1 phosphatase PAP2 family protein [Mesorhizobium sp. M4B.F.Ca.ET.013.02.1.1]RWF65404.1 MAG: phosphatase PAP2 family protein [Mesorhizobium sp.]TGQ08061.1 phosphatase PAP2 family protein [Mesorhizobium sp. M4B.F.Ca.ET.215.01.1.1]TGQ33025.1 phosphatase PAP2 family protein [Mesorhizobium sp. M4B.F.Ca.ET.214.01.1.1]TGQ35852.1 phosphatase PAP2 family protein [Mesorhizobium sp. M00.F.Ca.ET.220.01.1.1]